MTDAEKPIEWTDPTGTAWTRASESPDRYYWYTAGEDPNEPRRSWGSADRPNDWYYLPAQASVPPPVPPPEPVPVAQQVIPPRGSTPPVLGVPVASTPLPDPATTIGESVWGDCPCCCCSVKDLKFNTGLLRFADPHLMTAESSTEGEREWATDFCSGYYGWKDPKSDREAWCPTCFPCACLVPCSLIGANLTMMHEEDYIEGCNGCCEERVSSFTCGGCEMGNSGLSLCLCLAPTGLAAVGFFVFLGFVCTERRFIMNRYNIKGKDNWAHWCMGCCYPCAVMQHYTLLRTFNHANRIKPVSSAAGDPNSITQPSVDSAAGETEHLLSGPA